MTTKFRLRLRSLFFRGRMEQDLDEELRYHLEREIEEGTLRSTAGIAQRKEECRDMRGLNAIENAVQDFRYAIRGLRRSPAFAVLAVLVMALGIGANTAVFSVVNGVLLKPLAFRDPDRIVTMTTTWKSGANFNVVSLPDFHDWHDQSTAFSAMACYRSSDEPVKAGSSTEYTLVTRISPEFFQTLAIAPAIGRLFSAEEQRAGNSAMALISYAYWQSHFGGNPAALGQTVRVADQALTIAGVLPPGFHFPYTSDIWRPLDAVDRSLLRNSHCFFAIARLKPATSLEQGRAQLTSIAERLAQRYPDSNTGKSVLVTGMRAGMVGDVRCLPKQPPGPVKLPFVPPWAPAAAASSAC
ncbi:MAG: ABC transporter permease [Bryobacteraceae bacterium]